MATDGGNKVPLMLKKGAMLSACLVGVWVLVQLMTQFASAVKPLLLATMLAGCLEYIVQLFEVGLVRASRLVHCALCCQCCRGRRRRRPHGGAPDADERYLELEASSGAEDGSTSCLPEEVTAEWKLEDAGRFFLPRLVAVVMVLTVAAISIGQLVSSLVANLKNIDLQVYRQGLTELEQAILALAQKVSPDIKDQLQHAGNQVFSLERAGVRGHGQERNTGLGHDRHAHLSALDLHGSPGPESREKS
ncbi:unnamed protein product [Polarella glacialis]|uniref:Uncharacterized protein n=1 Tax=Polarella glacialis TaxID=89957 RepID=A0A813HJG8_POLGL|nr:unnamed protein product [Polarella glacialis]